MNIDFGLLEQALYVVTRERENALVTIPADLLTDRQEAERLLKRYQELIKGQDLQVAATYYAASWRVMLTAALYLMTVCDGSPDLSLANLTLQIEMVNNYPYVFFVLKNASVRSWPVDREDSWRRETLGHYVRETLRPVMETAAAVSKLPVMQLWGQMPLGVEYYLDYIGKQIGDPAGQAQLMESYAFLTKGLEAEWFGLKRNPYDLKETWLDDPYHPGEATRMKPTCCLAYRTESSGYCYGCPKLTKADREAMYREITAAAAAVAKEQANS
ncbi:(2Fe-2S)-binding protein [Paenibacillus sp. M1]|uniref:(2Fe-2S)-binding protein n=1 Tax=Paenibacillus haidiansis TaxID=1574488 RepID=A0ABU7VWV2_9BACL